VLERAGPVLFWVRICRLTPPDRPPTFAGEPDAKQKAAESVLAVAWSPDGITLASSNDKCALLWHVPTGKCVRVLRGHMNYVSCVSWSPDGKTLASGSEDTTVRLWDASSGVCVRIFFHLHQHWVRSVAWSPDGCTLATGGGDGVARLWSLDSHLVEKRWKQAEASFLAWWEAENASALAARATGTAPTGWVFPPEVFDVTVAPGTNVQAAVRACPPGGSVLLLPGTHEGPLRLEADKEVHIFGRGLATLRSATGTVVRRPPRQRWKGSSLGASWASPATTCEPVCQSTAARCGFRTAASRTRSPASPAL